MLYFNKVAFILFTVFASHVASKDGCRQCTGFSTLSFTDYISEAQAWTFLKNSIGTCATGSDVEVTRSVPIDCKSSCAGEDNLCIGPGVLICRSWVFHLTVWRFCGNGGSVSLNKGSVCDGQICATTNYLGMDCHKSVVCKSRCNCANCGC